MNKFRQKLRFKVYLQVLQAVGAAVLLAVICTVKGGAEALPAFIQGYDLGIFTSMEAVTIFMAVTNALALRNEEKLKKLYILDTDERALLIQQKSGSASFNIIMYGMLLADIASGFFSVTVFFTLLAAVVFIVLVKLFTALYYKRKLS